MLRWLKHKSTIAKQKRYLLIIIDNIITTQTTLANSQKHKITNTDWGLGYFCGVVDGVCQFWEITNSPETVADLWTLIHHAYKKYWNPKIPNYGMKLLSNSLDLLGENNKDFFDGLECGGNEVLSFIQRKKTPLALFDFLQEESNLALTVVHKSTPTVSQSNETLPHEESFIAYPTAPPSSSPQSFKKNTLTLGISFTLISGIASIIPDIQKAPYGVLIYATSLAFIMFRLMKLAKSWTIEFSYSIRLIILAFAFPIAASWIVNDFSTALNPEDYWTERYRAAFKDNCSFPKKMLFDAQDQLRVVVNKFNAGFATTQEIRDGQQGMQIAQEVVRDCIAKRNQEISLVQNNLIRLQIPTTGM